ncbi:C-type lectin domain family 17, member A-like isoform X3 [Struthio camelus]|uniref:C-type lectin domain family 17, member A-like isoform X3 n=1 Tax=Struthio camelus TaxID=8801 RepID=UPI003603EDB0
MPGTVSVPPGDPGDGVSEGGDRGDGAAVARDGAAVARDGAGAGSCVAAVERGLGGSWPACPRACPCDDDDYENVEPPPTTPRLPRKLRPGRAGATLAPPSAPAGRPCKAAAGDDYENVVPPLPPPAPLVPPKASPPPPAPLRDPPAGCWLQQRLRAEVGALREALGSQDEAAAAARTQQQQLQQDLASLRKSLAELLRPCPRGWATFGGSCYYFSAVGRRWREAEGFCAAHSAHLLIVNSAAEQDFVVRTAPQPRGYWLGLSDREKEGSWRWQDGTPLGLSFWSSGEPNGGRGENCATLLPDGRWNDLACERPDYWVCERPTGP